VKGTDSVREREGKSERNKPPPSGTNGVREASREATCKNA